MDLLGSLFQTICGLAPKPPNVGGDPIPNYPGGSLSFRQPAPQRVRVEPPTFKQLQEQKNRVEMQRASLQQQQRQNEKAQAEAYGRRVRDLRLNDAEMSAMQSFAKSAPMLIYLKQKSEEGNSLLPPVKFQ